MATIKSFTDIQQSKKLAKILPPESADMYYEPATGYCTKLSEVRFGNIKYAHPRSIRCWSLAALLSVIKKYGLIDLRFLSSTFDGRGNHLTNVWCCTFDDFGTVILDLYANNPIDACVEMILKLNELKML